MALSIRYRTLTKPASAESNPNTAMLFVGYICLLWFRLFGSYNERKVNGCLILFFLEIEWNVNKENNKYKVMLFSRMRIELDVFQHWPSTLLYAQSCYVINNTFD